MRRLLSLKIILLVLCVVLSSACKGSKDLVTDGGSSSQHSDSTYTVIKERIVTIHDTATIFIPVETTSSVGQQNSHLETSMATSDAYVDSTGILRHTLQNKEQEIQVPIEVNAKVNDSTHFESHIEVDTIFREVPYPVEKIVEKPLSWFQKTLMYSGVVFLLLVFGYVAYRIIRKRITP